MRITVAICTFNRAKLLARTLSCVEGVAVPDGIELQLVVVDNNSTDETDSVLSSFESRLPLLRLFEPKQGHTNARNTAIEHARGELILWTDDDVLVGREWIAEYARAAQSQPEAAFCARYGRRFPRCMPCENLGMSRSGSTRNACRSVRISRSEPMCSERIVTIRDWGAAARAWERATKQPCCEIS